ncbi:MAG: adenylyltransferase/cytidyltransferase family protein [archaeon]
MRVLAFGTFDSLHKGHFSYLRQAKALGSELFVVVARDATVKRMKARLPMQSEKKRLAEVGKIPFVDKALLGSRNRDFYAVVKKVRPEIICLGYDQWPNTMKMRRELGEIGIKAKIVRAKPFLPEKYHSSLLNEKK